MIERAEELPDDDPRIAAALSILRPDDDEEVEKSDLDGFLLKTPEIRATLAKAESPTSRMDGERRIRKIEISTRDSAGLQKTEDQRTALAKHVAGNLGDRLDALIDPAALA
jgi:hypothetical protein